jgi:hypothetical protein
MFNFGAQTNGLVPKLWIFSIFTIINVWSENSSDLVKNEQKQNFSFGV